MSKQKFKVGDRVRVVRSCVALGPLGDIGEIVCIDDIDVRFPYLVKIECTGYRPQIWCYEVEHIREKHPVIVITTDGKTTTATKREGKKIIKTATATCSDKDKFSFDEGARVAFERLQGRDPFPEEEKRPERPGKLVCVSNKICAVGLTEGKVYQISWVSDCRFFLRGLGYSGKYVDGKHIAQFTRGDVVFIPLVED